MLEEIALVALHTCGCSIYTGDDPADESHNPCCILSHAISQTHAVNLAGKMLRQWLLVATDLLVPNS